MIDGPTKNSQAKLKMLQENVKQLSKLFYWKFSRLKNLRLDFVEPKDELLMRILGWRPRSSAGLAELVIADSIEFAIKSKD